MFGITELLPLRCAWTARGTKVTGEKLAVLCKKVAGLIITHRRFMRLWGRQPKSLIGATVKVGKRLKRRSKTFTIKPIRNSRLPVYNLIKRLWVILNQSRCTLCKRTANFWVVPYFTSNLWFLGPFKARPTTQRLSNAQTYCYAASIGDHAVIQRGLVHAKVLKYLRYNLYLVVCISDSGN